MKRFGTRIGLSRLAAWGVLGAMALCGPALANDTAAQLGTGGLVFMKHDTVRMESEDLYISAAEVRVRYAFLNTGVVDEHVTVAFPMPDIETGLERVIAVPTDDPENIFGFGTTFNGEPVDARLHQRAFALGIDRTEELRELGIPLAAHTEAAVEAVDALSDADKDRLFFMGLVQPMEFDAGEGWQTQYFPAWTLRSAYVWDAVFPAGETAVVEHHYMPSVGGTAGVTFLSGPYDDYDPLGAYRTKYCLEDDIVATVHNSLEAPDRPWTAPYFEQWISYVLTTGANWSGPIGTFRMVVDKGDPENLVSFCAEGVRKTGPTTFEVTETDYYPFRDIEILILQKREPF